MKSVSRAVSRTAVLGCSTALATGKAGIVRRSPEPWDSYLLEGRGVHPNHPGPLRKGVGVAGAIGVRGLGRLCGAELRRVKVRMDE